MVEVSREKAKYLIIDLSAKMQLHWLIMEVTLQAPSNGLKLEIVPE